jgi:hypothetical protein
MRLNRNFLAGVCMSGALLFAAACSDDDDNDGGNPSPMEPGVDTTGDAPGDPTGGGTGASVRLTGVLPHDSVAADLVEDIRIVFSGAVAEGSSEFVDIHAGSTRGEAIEANCGLTSADAIISCEPVEPFEAGQEYWIHVGGGIRGFNGNPVDLTALGTLLGGTVVTDTAFVAGAHPAGTDSAGGSWTGDTTSRSGLVFRLRVQ